MPLDTSLLLFLSRFIVESDAIENIEADEELVRAQLAQNWSQGHVGALLRLEKVAGVKESIVTKEMICGVQGLITAEQHTKPGGKRLEKKWVGNYRTVPVYIGGKPGPHPDFVNPLMSTWVNKVSTWQKESSSSCDHAQKLQAVAQFHFEYEHIHPFADGNGRSGRALVYYLMRYGGMKPIVFTSIDKYETYYRCFKNPEAMHRYFEIKYNS